MAKRAPRKPKTIPESRAPDEGLLSTEFIFSDWKLALFHVAIILAAGLWIYSPALYGDWLWDDSLYISQNPLMNDPERLWKAWFQPGSFVEYYPIEQTLQWWQWQMWGNNTFGYHLTNVGLHLLSALLVWRVLHKFGLRLAWVGGLIFAIHPVMVESVAWITEFKNTLSLPPFLMAICAYLDYEERKRRADYLQALAWFLVAMLCKIAMAPFPVIILLFAWWKRGRIGWRDVQASAPFFLISLILGSITVGCGTWYWQAQLKVPPVVDIGGFFSRLALVGQTLSFYFVKCFWPLNPLPIYPQWRVDPSSPAQFAPWLVLAGVAAWLWQKRRDWGRHVLLGLGFFILTLGIFLGFLATSYMSFTWTMDHFLYFPIIGVIGIVVAGMERLDDQLPSVLHPVSTGILTVLMGLLALESHWYAAAFTNEETFWNYTIERNPAAWPGQENLGNALLQAGEPEQARHHFDILIRLKPDYADGYCDLAGALVALDRIPEAIEALHQALQRDPNSPEAQNNLGVVLARTGHPDQALVHFAQVLSRHPGYAEAYNNRGNTFLQMGRIPDAVDQYELAVKTKPDFLGARCNLGIALARLGRIPEAADQFETVLQMDPGNAVAKDSLAKLQAAPSAPPAK